MKTRYSSLSLILLPLLLLMPLSSAQPIPEADSDISKAIQDALLRTRSYSQRQQYFDEETQRVLYELIEAEYPFPKDFYEIRFMYANNFLDFNPDIIDSNYWVQPETQLPVT